MKHTTRGILFTIVGLAALVAALPDTKLRFLAVLVALICLFIAGTAFSLATQFAGSLRPFVKKTARVEVWGIAIPDSAETMFEIDSIAAFGAGLLIHLRATSSGPRVLLKVAQPTSMTLLEDRIEISDAAYVSCAPHIADSVSGGEGSGDHTVSHTRSRKAFSIRPVRPQIS